MIPGGLQPPICAADYWLLLDHDGHVAACDAAETGTGAVSYCSHRRRARPALGLMVEVYTTLDRQQVERIEPRPATGVGK